MTGGHRPRVLLASPVMDHRPFPLLFRSGAGVLTRFWNSMQKKRNNKGEESSSREVNVHFNKYSITGFWESQPTNCTDT